MDEVAEIHFRLAARLAVLEKREGEYEEHFKALMSALHGADFEPVRPAGRFGDRKCDGYLRSTATVFQSYAPKVMKSAATVAKIEEDFAGAVAQWEGMRGWTFVHNQDEGLPPDAVQAVDALARANPGLSVSTWGPAEVRALSVGLDEARLVDLFGPPPRRSDLLSLEYGEIAAVVRAVAQDLGGTAATDAVRREVDPAKLEHNAFGPETEALLVAGLLSAWAIEGYFADQQDPGLRDRLAAGLAGRYAGLRARGLGPDEVLQKLLDPLYRSAVTTREASAGLALVAHLFETCDLFENPPEPAPAAGAAL